MGDLRKEDAVIKSKQKKKEREIENDLFSNLQHSPQ
jgi:hypothetical protein